MRPSLSHELASRVPLLSPDLIQAYLAGVSAEYRQAFSLDEIAGHLQVVQQAEAGMARLSITARKEGTYEVIIAARDYFSELAVITGLLAAFGLDIQEGYIGGTGRVILDIFRVQPAKTGEFSKHEHEQFEAELSQLLDLLADNRFHDARAKVNRRLTEVIGRARPSPKLLEPIEVRFENRAGADWTRMEITAPDAPGFLYAFVNALAMRGTTVRTAVLKSSRQLVHDWFGVTDRYGRKITDPKAQAALRITTVLIKQFTHCLSAAPDPAKALAHFDRMLDQVLEQTEGHGLPGFFQELATLDLLARLFGTSDFLWEDFLRRHSETLLPLLQQPSQGRHASTRTQLVRDLRRTLAQAHSGEEQKLALNQFKDRELFRIDLQHLLDPQQRLEPFATALSDLADVVLNETLRLCQERLGRSFGRPRLSDGRACGFAICGLGKFGGREMGYASDIELLFAYRGPGQTDGPRMIANSEYFERLSQEIIGFIEAKQEGIFHLDVRLRPHGKKGLLAASLEELAAYYSPQGLASPFERQALIKLRWVAGSQSLGERIEAVRDRFVYSGAPWDLTAALDLRHRQALELVPGGVVNIKYSPGGLVDIEYAAQYLQILHGARHKTVRTPSTLAALRALRRTGKLSRGEEAMLIRNYRFLRRLIDALRIVRGNARDLVLPPADSEEFIFLARRMGYQARQWSAAAAHLQRDIHHHMAETQQFFRAHFRS
jgi:glutamate-ammonia-ligase adenylyltransferase